MKCTNCGQENPEGMKFCSLCGSLMPAAPVQPINVSAPSPASTAAPVTSTPATSAPANTSLEPENTLFIQESEIEKTSVIFCDEKFKIIDSALAETCKNELINKTGGILLSNKDAITVENGIIEYSGGNDTGKPAIYDKENAWKVVNALKEIAKDHNLNVYIQIYSCYVTEDYDGNDSDGHDWYIFGKFNGHDYYIEKSAISYFEECSANDWDPIVFEEYSGESIIESIFEAFCDEDESYWTDENTDGLYALIEKLFTHPEATSADLY